MRSLSPDSWPKKMWAAILIVLAYVAARLTLFGIWTTDSYTEWAYRDSLVSVFRLAALGILLWKFRLPSKSQLFNSERFQMMTMVASLAALVFTDFIFGGAGFYFDPAYVSTYTLVTFNSLIVAFFEEFLFRGVFLGLCLQKFKPGLAILASALIFMGFHLGAQDLSTLPLNLGFGLALGLLRVGGVGLINLVAFHFFYSLLEPFWGGTPKAPTFEYILFVGCYFLSAAVIAGLLYKYRAQIFVWKKSDDWGPIGSDERANPT